MRAGMRPLLPQADLQGAEGAQSHAAMRGWAELQPPTPIVTRGQGRFAIPEHWQSCCWTRQQRCLAVARWGASFSLATRVLFKWGKRTVGLAGRPRAARSCSVSASRMAGGGVLQRRLCLAPRQLRQAKRGLAPHRTAHHHLSICQARATLSPSCSCSQLLTAEQR